MLKRIFISLVQVASLVLAASLYAQEPQKVIEEVVVTAGKRSENLQDVSHAVTALTASAIQASDLDSFVDIETLAPGVTISKNEGIRTVITVRGVGNEANQNVIANPAVSYHLDGIYVASAFALSTDFLDLDRIELLRGPQGTLFGQNSTGGAINVVTVAPEAGEMFGRTDIAIGNFDHVKVRGAVNVPLGSTLAARISGILFKHDGYSENISLNQMLDDANSRSARVRLRHDAGNDWTVDLIAQYFDEEINGSAQKGLLDPTKNPRNLAQDSPSRYELEAQLYGLVVEKAFEWGALKSLTSYQQDTIQVVRDNDRTDLDALPPFTVLPAEVVPENNSQTTFSQEFHVVSEPATAQDIEWVAGVFYLDTSVEFEFLERIDFGFDGEFDPFTMEQVRNFEAGDFGFISDSNPHRKSASAFAQATYPWQERSRVILGARHTQDRVRSEVNNFFGRSGVEQLRIESDKLTGRMAIEFDISSLSMFYVSYARGFKPGGSNLTFGRENEIAPIVVLPTYEAEIVDTMEAGIKVDFADRRARLNAAIFLTDFENLQYHATDPEVFEGGVGNLPESQIRGIEVEMFAWIGSNWDLNARAALIDSEITASHLSLDNVDTDAVTNALLAQGESLFGPAIQQARALAIKEVKGNQLAKTPRSTFDLTLRRLFDLRTGAKIETSVQFVHRGEFQHRIFNNPRADNVPSYRRWNLYAKYIPASELWHLAARVKNLTNEAGINSQFTDVFGVGATSYELIPPRTISLQFSKEF